MTATHFVVSMDNMKAEKLFQQRKPDSDVSFWSAVVWRLPHPVAGSAHLFKYRLAYVIHDEYVIRYDNETGKGDHKHIGALELPYAFADVPALLADFFADIQRWKDENGID